MDEHVAIVRRRRELRASAEDRRAVIACDLGVIADLVRCLHDECLSVDGASASSDVRDAISDALRGAAVLDELATLHSVDDAFAARAIDAGPSREPDPRVDDVRPIAAARTPG